MTRPKNPLLREAVAIIKDTQTDLSVWVEDDHEIEAEGFCTPEVLCSTHDLLKRIPKFLKEATKNGY